MEGATGNEEVDKLMSAFMTPDAITAHMAEKHAGQPVPTREQVRAGLLATAVHV
ncbi:MAG: hypothetical protein WCB85_00925 [Candidatus Dormiibacterota bacterium]